MAIITKITRQKNNTERYNIYIEEAYAFAVDESLIVKYQLTKNKILEDWERDEIVFDDEIRKAFNKALHFLAFRMRSEYEVKKKLLDLEYGEAVVLEAIQKLHNLGFLNDEAFSKAFLETQKKTSKKGPRVIQQELKKKGIEKSLQEEVLKTYTEEDQTQIAQGLAEKIANQQSSKTPRQVKQKIQDTLLRKGYSYATISKVIEEIEFETEQDEWEEMIADQGDKIWRKVSIKYTGYDRKNRVKQALYQKGFPSEQIEMFIEKKELEEDGD
ncbi:recombination regulator RecX [Paenisporosarcina antarctica]|uniref:Regulatory protein RecX n=1 Tax=Paenisporosarcina antarctica TaxID=417367 RepID=A0A4P6ZVU7_9BACL|nr:recombination regulator RecX [Paenisporosarcina antarctica]QBP40363.1 recombination regulator RecX [Paenisporosarcina antarctica]